jgi:hypothetical protein
MKIDTEAIAHHLNQSLTLNGIIGVTAKVSVNHDCLKIVLVSEGNKESTDKDGLLQVTITSLRDLELITIQTVKIHGQQINSFDLDWSYKYKYGLFSENNSNYFQDNQTKHQIKRQNATSNNQVKRDKIKVSQAEFEEELKKCSKMANSAYDISIRYAKKIEIAIKNLNSNLETISHKILKIKGSEQFQFATELEQIQLDIQKLSEDSLEDLVISLNQKRKHLEYFGV